MINSVNSLPLVQNVNSSQYTTQRVTNPQQQPVSYPVQNVNMGGTEALASYNKAFASTTEPKTVQPLMPTVMQPEAIKYLMQKGTPINNSNGDLNSIVVKNDKTTVVYTMDVLAPNDAISKIETFDNETGNIIQRQENFNIIEKGKLPKAQSIDISKYNPQTGERVADTYYDEEGLQFAREIENLPDGTQKVSIVNFKTKESSIVEKNEAASVSKRTDFDKDGKIKEVETHNWATHTTEKTKYKDGKIIGKTEVTQAYPIPNTTGKDPLNDVQLKPSAPVVLNYDPSKVEGEKTYYSNGAVELITTETEHGKVVHAFAPNGDLTGIEYDDGKKSIIYTNGDTSINEELAPDVIKTTTYHKDGFVDVNVTDRKNDTEKNAFYEKDGVFASYVEISKDNRMLMDFDKQGNLIGVE